MVTTYYYPDGTTDSTEEYLYTTYYDDCGGGCTPIEDGLGGSGGSNDPGTAVSHQVKLTVWQETTSYEDWEIFANFTVTGLSFSIAANNYFTAPGITWDGGDTWHSNTSAANGWPQGPYYLIYNFGRTISQLLDPYTASGSLGSSVTYPNQLDQDGKPIVKGYYLGQTWQASVALY